MLTDNIYSNVLQITHSLTLRKMVTLQLYYTSRNNTQLWHH